MLAFEVAQQLRATGEEVGLLAIIDSDVPGDARYRLAFRLRRAIGRVFRLNSADKAGQNLIVASQEEPLGNLVLERNHGYLAAMQHYQAKPYAGQAVFVEAALDGEHTPFGWNRLIPDLQVHRLPADHLGVMQPEMAPRLATILQNALN